jgi:hypothetical protein
MSAQPRINLPRTENEAAMESEGVDFNFSFSFRFEGGDEVARFDSEKMAVYRLARLHGRAVCRLTEAADTHGFADLINELRRSAASVPAIFWKPPANGAPASASATCGSQRARPGNAGHTPTA